jgi:tricarballylate dehydrogenase
MAGVRPLSSDHESMNDGVRMGSDPVTIVVVGSGAAGLSAALTAAEAAAAGIRIVLIDKALEGQHGGNTRWSPSYMRMAAPDRADPDLEAYVQAVSRGLADSGYFRRLGEEAPAAVAWLERHGVAFHQPVYYLSAGSARIQPVGGGSAIVAALGAAARAAGVEIHYEINAERLLLGSDGAVEGIEVRAANGARERIAARAVVLASGGFEGNGAMLAQHLGAGAESLKRISPGTRLNTGDGIRMALDAGARTAGDWSGMHIEPVDPRSVNAAPVVLVYPYGIVVDRDGRRFIDEGGGLVHETWEALARAIHFDTPGRIAYAILDARLNDIPDYGRAIRSDVPPYQAGSLEALAALAGIAPQPLVETVAHYNAAATGDQARFDAARADGLRSSPGLSPPKSNWCRPLDKPPYLAYPLIGAIAYTFGGLATNADAEVLGQAGPIPGLFAAGEITGHFHGMAPNAVAVLRALVFGRVAGQRAVAFCG